MDAVNMSQLNALDEKASGSVAYDTASKNVVTFGGKGGAPAVVLTNLKAGMLSAQSSDAVNGAQLNATNSDVHDISASLALLTRAEPLKLAYTDDGKSSIVLGGGAGTILSNVKAGVADQDAVNVAQLKSAGLIDPMGNTTAAITYDSKADGSINRNSVTLGGPGAGLPVALHNVAAGVVRAGSTDAVNGDQLFQTAQLVDGLQNGAALKYFVSRTTLAAATAGGPNATAIGGNAQATAGNTVALGANSVADRLNSVSVGAAGNERQITNVQAGTADTDAVNVGQLKSAGLVDQTGKAVTALAYDKDASGATDFRNVTLGQGIAGGTAIHNVGAGTLATDAVNLGQLNDIVTHVSNFVTSSSALYSAAGDASTEAATASGTHALAMGANATASAAGSVALGANSLADRASSVSVGAVGSERQITNVAAGTSATDAVNLSQLNQSASSTLSQANSYTDQRFNNTDQQIRDLDRNTRKGIASASALNVVTPYLPGRTTLNAGVAAYRGQAALGIGVSRWNDKGNINFNGGVSSSGGNSTIVRAGVGYVFGS
jgi:autotransporter adhesin